MRHGFRNPKRHVRGRKTFILASFGAGWFTGLCGSLALIANALPSFAWYESPAVEVGLRHDRVPQTKIPARHPDDGQIEFRRMSTGLSR